MTTTARPTNDDLYNRHQIVQEARFKASLQNKSWEEQTPEEWKQEREARRAAERAMRNERWRQLQLEFPPEVTGQMEEEAMRHSHSEAMWQCLQQWLHFGLHREGFIRMRDHQCLQPRCEEPLFDRFFCLRDYVKVHRSCKESGYRIWKDYVFWHDGSVCWLCHEEIDRWLPSTNVMSGSLDHVVPQSLGGSDDPGNLRPAHRRCNSSRQDKHPGVYRDLQFTPNDMAKVLAKKTYQGVS